MTGRTAPENVKYDEEWQCPRRMTISVEDVRAKFPIKNIPNIIGEPIYKAINGLREALYANAAATPTALRGGGSMLTTDIYTVKFGKECTASRRRVSFTISNYSHSWNPKVTYHANTHQSYGGTSGDQSHYHWWLMT